MTVVTNRPSITGLLRAYAAGDEAALNRLFDQVYPDLRHLARRQLLSSRPGQTLNTTGLVHEAYLKLAQGVQLELNDRRHFFAVAARVMRQIIVDAARERLTAKRGGGRRIETLDDGVPADSRAVEDLMALDTAMDRLTDLDSRLAQVVECRYFAGFSEAETADILRISVRTVQREWNLARGWLRAHLSP